MGFPKLQNTQMHCLPFQPVQELALVNIMAVSLMILKTRKLLNQTLGVHQVALIGKNLGSFIDDSKDKKLIKMEFIQKLHKKLQIWQSRHLSQAGRLILCNQVLSTMPIQPTTILSASCLNKMERIIRRFWWHGHDTQQQINLLSCDPS